MNPMAAPYLYGSMFPMTQQQSGHDDACRAGADDGNRLGAIERRAARRRPGARAATAPQSTVAGRGTANQPGGLAARYFNRHDGQKPRIPQSFYNRQNRTIRKLRDKNNPRGFDLSERAIVPIVSLVKTDPPLCGSAASCGSEFDGEQQPWAIGIWDPGIVAGSRTVRRIRGAAVRPMSECREECVAWIAQE